MDLAGIKASTDELVAQFPGLESFIDHQLAKVQETITEGINTALAGVADGIGQVVALGLALDGATVTVEASGPIVLPAIVLPRFTITVNMPLKSAK